MGILYSLSQIFGIKVNKENNGSKVDIDEIDLEELKAIEENIEEINLSDLIKVDINVTKKAQDVNGAINIEAGERPTIASAKIANNKNNITQKKSMNRVKSEDIEK